MIGTAAAMYGCLGWCSLCWAEVRHFFGSKEGTWFGPCGHGSHVGATLLQDKPIVWRAPT